MYEDSTKRSEIIYSLDAGDTITTLIPIQLHKWNAIVFRSKQGYINNPSLYAISAQSKLRTTKRRNTNTANDQDGFGLGLGYSSNNAFLIDALFKRARLMYRVGYTRQFNGQLGVAKSERLSNYGTTGTGSGQYFVALTLGCSYWLTQRIAVGVEGHLGSDRYYTNYSDRRFTGGGFHMIDGSYAKAGIGGKIEFIVNKWLMLSGGYSTLTEINVTANFVSFSVK